jgi:hypothetical protein
LQKGESIAFVFICWESAATSLTLIDKPLTTTRAPFSSKTWIHGCVANFSPILSFNCGSLKIAKSVGIETVLDDIPSNGLNNQFTELPADLFAANRALANFDLKGNPTTTLPSGFFKNMKISKKSKFMMPCSLETIPVDVLLDKKIVKSFLKAAKFC